VASGGRLRRRQSKHVCGLTIIPAQNLLRGGVEWNTGRPSR
jgi:hypothetical protein